VTNFRTADGWKGSGRKRSWRGWGYLRELSARTGEVPSNYRKCHLSNTLYIHVTVHRNRFLFK